MGAFGRGPRGDLEQSLGRGRLSPEQTAVGGQSSFSLTWGPRRGWAPLGPLPVPSALPAAVHSAPVMCSEVRASQGMGLDEPLPPWAGQEARYLQPVVKREEENERCRGRGVCKGALDRRSGNASDEPAFLLRPQGSAQAGDVQAVGRPGGGRGQEADVCQGRGHSEWALGSWVGTFLWDHGLSSTPGTVG